MDPEWVKNFPTSFVFWQAITMETGAQLSAHEDFRAHVFLRRQRQCKLFCAQPPILACGRFRGCPRQLCTDPAASLKRKGDRSTPQTRTGSHQEEETATNRPSTQAFESMGSNRTTLSFAGRLDRMVLGTTL